LEDLELALQFQLGTNAKVISLEPFAICDVWKDILHVGAACGVQDHAAALISDLKQRMANLSAAHTAKTSRPRVAALEWLEPLMAAGNWVPELITKAGGENLFGEAGQHSPWMTWDELLRADPGVIVALPCGFDLARTRAEMNWLTRRTGWSQLKAVQNGQVYLCDGNQYMNRPGPRLVESLQIFCEILHPELFAPDLRGSAWEPLE
jgi:iron complex transport system substrate-binding protein